MKWMLKDVAVIVLVVVVIIAGVTIYAVAASKKFECPNCGHLSRGNFCSECGTEIERTVDISELTNNAKRIRWLTIMMVGFVCFSVSQGAIAIIRLSKSESSDSGISVGLLSNVALFAGCLVMVLILYSAILTNLAAFV